MIFEIKWLTSDVINGNIITIHSSVELKTKKDADDFLINLFSDENVWSISTEVK